MNEKQCVFQEVQKQADDLIRMAESIFDHPELGHEEYFAQKQVASYLKENGFEVELGVGGVKTSLRGEYKSLGGGVTVALWIRFLSASTGVYELLPGFCVGLLLSVIVSLIDKAPSKEVLELFDRAADPANDD